MPHADRPLLIGLTGGVASGKSTVAGMLQERGYEVISSDKAAHDALREPQTIRRIVARYGEAVLREGVIDRKALGEIVFADKQALADLNSIVHPRVRARLDDAVSASNAATLFIEIPLLFDSALEDRFDAIVTIEADLETRLRVLMQRDGLSRQQAEARFAAQLSEHDRRQRADYVLVNPMTMTYLVSEVDALVSWVSHQKKRIVKNFTAKN